MKTNHIKIFVMGLIIAALCLAACAQDTDSDFEGQISGAMSPYETKEVTLSLTTLRWNEVLGLDRGGVERYEIYRSSKLLTGYAVDTKQPNPKDNPSCSGMTLGSGTVYFRIKTYFKDGSSGPLSSAFATNAK